MKLAILSIRAIFAVLSIGLALTFRQGFELWPLFLLVIVTYLCVDSTLHRTEKRRAEES